MGQTLVGDEFAPTDELAAMTDAAIVDVMMEDVPAVLDGSTWTIERNVEETSDEAGR